MIAVIVMSRLCPPKLLLTSIILLASMPLLQSAAANANRSGRDARSHDPIALGVRGLSFTLNDTPTFLLGISYYGGLGASESFARDDLDDLRRHGFNWLRVWATWAAFDNDISAIDTTGRARKPFLDKLRWLVAECERRGMIVDVTLTRRKPSAGVSPGGSLPTFEAHRRAMDTIVTALKPHRNWYLDMANERDVRDDRYVPANELKAMRDLVRRLDPERLVTASFGGHDLGESDIREGLSDIGLDFLAPHRPRAPESPRQTQQKTRAYIDMTKRLDRAAPVHYQEPFRRGYGAWNPVATDFLTDLDGAIAGGAAGWCLHNGSERGTADMKPRRSFDLRAARLMDQLDAEERKVVEGARDVVIRFQSRP